MPGPANGSALIRQVAASLDLSDASVAIGGVADGLIERGGYPREFQTSGGRGEKRRRRRST